MIVAVVLLFAAASAPLVAVTVTDFALVLLGTVNKPEGEMLPALADQVTAVLLVLLTTAENCAFPPAATVGSAGEICTVTHWPQAATVMVYARKPEVPFGSPLTATKNANVPASVGIPEMLPVCGSRTSPGGTLPSLIAKL